MITVVLSGQLGNTMFQYAAIKTIAQDKGLTFRYARIPTPLVNSTDPRRGSEIDTIFNISPEEKTHFGTGTTSTYYEKPAKQRVLSNYKETLYNDIQDGQLIYGVFATPTIIEHNLENVRQWFTFPSESITRAEQFLDKNRKGKITCTVHFRVGDDYFALGYRLHKSYWYKAAKKVLEQYPDTQFICLYDKKRRFIEDFIQEFNALEYHSSLVDDMAMMTVTDANIVCNSTFSIMGAILNPKARLGVCPSIYPPASADMAPNTYSDHWIRIEDSKQDIFSAAALATRNMVKAILRWLHIRR